VFENSGDLKKFKEEVGGEKEKGDLVVPTDKSASEAESPKRREETGLTVHVP